MKQRIDPKDIRKGDLIRWGGENDSANEFRARMTGLDAIYNSLPGGVYYLLDRPEPPFEPYWGMVIGKPGDNTKLAVYLPMEGATQLGWLCTVGDKWIGNAEAKQKLAGGWVVIDKPEGVK